MKRKILIISLVICLSVVFLFAGCGTAKKEDAPQQANVPETVQPVQEPSSGEISSEEPTVEEPETEEPASADSVYVPGKAKKKSFVSKMLHLKFKLPKGWKFYSKKKLAKLNNSSKEPTVEEIVAGMEKNGVWYEMFAQGDNGENISILAEKNEGLQAFIQSKGIENIVKDLKSSVVDSLKGVGAKKIKVKSVDREFPLEDYAVLKITMKLNGVKVIQYQFVKGVGDYMYTVTITCLNKDTSKKLIKKFSAVN